MVFAEFLSLLRAQTKSSMRFIDLLAPKEKPGTFLIVVEINKKTVKKNVEKRSAKSQIIIYNKIAKTTLGKIMNWKLETGVIFPTRVVL